MFFAILFWKCSKNFFSIKITNKICPRHCIFNFFNLKNFFIPIWSVTFCQSILYFYILTISLILNLGSLLLISLLEPMYLLDFTLAGFILIVLWYVLLYLLTISHLIIHNNQIIVSLILFFKGITNAYLL